MQKQDDERVKKFTVMRGRQVAAIAIAIVSLLAVAAASRRPDIFGAYSRKTILVVLLGIILAFINFSSWNWRCPVCRRYLGSDLDKDRCKACGTRFR